MAFSRILLACLLLSLLAAHPLMAVQVEKGQAAVAPIDCGKECGRRCQLSSRPNLCNRACGTCCRRCNCVPPGTAGNYEVCPCYAAQKTHGGRPKCP